MLPPSKIKVLLGSGLDTLSFEFWKKLTNDPYVLDIQFGVRLDFLKLPAFKHPRLAHFSKAQELAITQELAVLIQNSASIYILLL